DFNPSEFLAREKMLYIISQVFRSFGYNPIETPIVEFAKVLTGADETSKNIFQVKSRGSHGDESLALRFDHTIPFARFLSANPYSEKNHTGVKLPWRRMVLGPVFRSDSPQKGRYRQFYQFDVDIAGSSLMLADAEIIAIIYKTLKALGLDRFVIKVNNRKILNGLAELIGISDHGQVKAEDITKEVMRILDKIPKVGLPAVLVELQQVPDNDYDLSPGLDVAAIKQITRYLDIAGSNSEKIVQAESIFQNISIATEGLSELKEILNHLNSLQIPESAVEINFSIARGLDYYTGPVFESFLLDALEFGSIFSGGRYNDLVARFTGSELPSVGASIGVDRLFSALQHLGLVEVKQTAVSEVLILRLASNRDDYYLTISDRLRKLGFKVEICLLEDTTFKSQFNFAVSQAVNFVIIAGEDEIKREVIKLKNLVTRQQVEVSNLNIIEGFTLLSKKSKHEEA
ncbi:MAG: histidine--tRNA ligase, partial [Candidatus Falkowbacteria bacterium]|nr:histidine--tRNA ligase [Candidatus Falkowbacteria bacterium]